MSCDMKMYYVIAQFYPAFFEQWPALRNNYITRFRGLPVEVLDILWKAIWVQSHINYSIWTPFFRKHEFRMFCCPLFFVKYVMFACHIIIDKTEDVYQQVASVYGFVLAAVLRCFYLTGQDCFMLTPYILTIFYDMMLKNKFNKRGGWSRIFNYFSDEEYIVDHDKFQWSSNPDVEDDEVFRKKMAKYVRVFGYNTGDIDQITVETHESSVYLTEIMFRHRKLSALGKSPSLGQMTAMKLIYTYKDRTRFFNSIVDILTQKLKDIASGNQKINIIIRELNTE